jgi:protein-tyrosine-phosphatase
MMQAILHDRRPDWLVESAGVSPTLEAGRPVNRQAKRTLKKHDLSGWPHLSRFVPRGQYSQYDAVLNLTGREGPVAGHPNARTFSIPNPYGKGPAAYERCFRALEQAADLFITHLEDK